MNVGKRAQLSRSLVQSPGDKKVSRRKSSEVYTHENVGISSYLKEVLTKTEVEIANKRVSDFYPLKQVPFNNLFPLHNRIHSYYKSMKKGMGGNKTAIQPL